MQLIVTDKPGTCESIAAAVGAKQKQKGLFEGNGYIVARCRKNLVDFVGPSGYNPRFNEERYESLPIIPAEWKLQVNESCKHEFLRFQSLCRRQDVDVIVNACEASRDGEMAFRHVAQLAGNTKPVKRMWLNAQSQEEIMYQLHNLQPAAEYDSLYNAAVAKAKGDWLIGINHTNYYSEIYGAYLPAGRVKTRYLALIAEQQELVEQFVPQDTYLVQADCGPFVAHSVASTAKDAERIVNECQGAECYVSSVRESTQVIDPPPLYSLPALQFDAQKIRGYSLKQTQDVCQSLYNNGWISYPFTSETKLPPALHDSFEAVIGPLMQSDKAHLAPEPAIANEALVFDKSVGHNHAIIPTAKVLQADLDQLPTAERFVLDLIMHRAMIATMQPQTEHTVKVNLDIKSNSFTMAGDFLYPEEGINPNKPGFKQHEKAFYSYLGYSPEIEERYIFPPISEGSLFNVQDVTFHQKETPRPQPFSEADLVVNPAAGIAAAGSRANTIDALVQNGYVRREGLQLAMTQKGKDFCSVVDDALKGADLSTWWGDRLALVEKGALPAADFVTEVAENVRGQITAGKEVLGWLSPEERAAARETFAPAHNCVGECPRCKGQGQAGRVMEGQKDYYCNTKSCGFKMWKQDRFFVNKGHTLTLELAQEFLKTGRVTLTNCTTPKSKRRYSIIAKLQDNGQHVSYGFVDFCNKKKQPQPQREITKITRSTR